MQEGRTVQLDKANDYRTGITTSNSKDLILAIYTFFTLFFPDSYRVFRLILLMILVFVTAIDIKTFKITTGTYILFLLIISNVFFMIWGLINHAPGALRVQTVDILWPILFYIVSLGIKNERDFEKLQKILLFSYFCVCVFDLIYIGSSLIGISLPFIYPFLDILECNFGNYGIFIQYTTTHMCTHIFMAPFTITLLKCKRKPINKKALFILSGMAALCVLMSGRVALIITFIGSSSLGLLLQDKDKKFQKGGKMKYILAGLCLCGIVLLILNKLGIQISAIVDYAIDKFQSSADPTHSENGVRAVQKSALINGWKESPIIGHGAGSYTPLSIRDENMLWAYEYSYYALLFQKGIIGLAISVLFYIWIGITLLKKKKNNEIDSSICNSFLVGFIAILIANYADPYLGKLGCMWMVFFPYAIVNSRQNNNLIGEII